MFIIDATFEDTRILAQSAGGSDFNVTLVDGASGRCLTDLHATQDEVRAMMDCAISHDGEGSGESHKIVSDWNTRNNIPHELSLCA